MNILRHQLCVSLHWEILCLATCILSLETRFISNNFLGIRIIWSCPTISSQPVCSVTAENNKLQCYYGAGLAIYGGWAMFTCVMLFGIIVVSPFVSYSHLGVIAACYITITCTNSKCFHRLLGCISGKQESPGLLVDIQWSDSPLFHRRPYLPLCWLNHHWLG